MTTNNERRIALSDAGLRVLARDGPRGLTHRAVDKEAGCPAGTTSNYHRSRDTLLSALADRIYERLAPPPEVLANPTAKPASVETVVEYVLAIVRRAQDAPDLYVALLELRLEARRTPLLAPKLGATLHRGYCGDVEFHRSAQLPGDALEIALLHYAIDGLLLDRLGASISSAETTEEAVRLLVTRLVKPAERPLARYGGGIDAYIAGSPEATRLMLESVRRAIKKAAPEATETIKYGFPTFVLGEDLVHFAAFKKHIGFYLAPSAIAAFREQLSAYKSAKGSVQFPLASKMPLKLIEQMVRFRVKEVRSKRLG